MSVALLDVGDRNAVLADLAQERADRRIEQMRLVREDHRADPVEIEDAGDRHVALGVVEIPAVVI